MKILSNYFLLSFLIFFFSCEGKQVKDNNTQCNKDTAIKTIMKRKRKIFFTVEDFSLCCLRISEFLMKAGAPLINQCISHIKAFIQIESGMIIRIGKKKIVKVK